MDINKKSKQYRQLYQSFKQNSKEFQSQQANKFYAALPQSEQSYKKSNKPLKNLKLISIKDLMINNVHKGRYLKLKIILPPFRVNAIRILAEDHTQQYCIDISLYNFQLKGKSLKSYFPVGSIFYIKQPFYKVSLALTNIIRIDNPSEIILSNYQEAQQLVAQKQKQIIKEDQELSKLQQLRLLGIDYMNKNLYAKAYLLYSEALKNCNNPDYKIKFLLNKGIVCMKLNLKQQYGQYIEKALQLDQKNIKILYHKGKQLAMIGKFQEAQRMLVQSNFDKNTKQQLAKFINIQRSFKQNKVDWYRALKYKQLGQLFHKDIKIDKSPYGRGIFANKNLKAGQVVIVQRPLLSTTSKESKSVHSPLGQIFQQLQQLKSIVGKKDEIQMKNNIIQLYHTSAQFKKKIDKLSSNYEQDLKKYNYPSIKGSQMDLYGIAENNWFQLSQFDEFFQFKKKCLRTGLYQNICMLNHCCEYNCQRFCLDDTMLVYCVKDIDAGQELFITYKASQDYLERRQSLHHWNIYCDCIFCQEQQYELTHGQPMTHGKSYQMEKLQMIQDFKKNGVSPKGIKRFQEFYDMQSIALVLIAGRDVEKAAKMLRRIFPMPNDKSIELMQNLKKS